MKIKYVPTKNIISYRKSAFTAFELALLLWLLSDNMKYEIFGAATYTCVIVGSILILLYITSLLLNIIVGTYEAVFYPMPDTKLPNFDFKPVFDHLRNFGISAAISSAGFILIKKGSDGLHEIGGYMLVLLGFFLMLANITDGAVKIMRTYKTMYGVKLLAATYIVLVVAVGGTVLFEYLSKPTSI